MVGIFGCVNGGTGISTLAPQGVERGLEGDVAGGGSMGR